MTMGRLAGHVAELPTFATRAIQQDSFNAGKVLAIYDEGVVESVSGATMPPS